MSGDLYFYKVKIFHEDLAAQLNRDEIDKALKGLLANRDLDGKDEELRKRIFEEIKVTIRLSGSEPKIKEFFSNHELLVAPNCSIFLMNQEIWAAISECIFEECAKKDAEKPSTKDSKKKKKEEEKPSTEDSNKSQEEKPSAEDSNKKDDFKERLEPIKPLLKDYFILDDLFKKNLLVVNIF